MFLTINSVKKGHSFRIPISVDGSCRVVGFVTTAALLSSGTPPKKNETTTRTKCRCFPAMQERNNNGNSSLKRLVFFPWILLHYPLSKSIYAKKSSTIRPHKIKFVPIPQKTNLFFKVLQEFLQSISDSQKSIADPWKLKVPNPIRRLRWGVDQGQHAISTGANEREHPEDSEPKHPWSLKPDPKKLMWTPPKKK